MKCLLLLDFYALWKQLKIFLFFILAYAVGSLITGQYMFLGFAVMFLLMLPYYLQQLLEGGQVDASLLLAPIGRRTIVGARYLTVLLCVLPALALAAGAWAVLGADAALQLLLQTAASLVGISIILPLLYRFGAAKSRMLLLLMFALFFGSTGLISGFSEEISLAALGGWFPWLVRLALPAALAVLGLSWLVSVRIYEKREF